MRVVFNALASYRPKTGVGHYAARLLAELPTHLPAHTLDAFPSEPLAGLLSRLQRPGGGPPARGGIARLLAGVKAVGIGAAKLAARASLEMAFRRTCRRGGYDVYHEPNFIPFAADVPAVATVHDLSVLLHPEWHPADRVRLYERHFEAGLRRCRHIITVSEFVRREVIAELGLAPENVTAVPNGVGPEYGRATAADIAAVRVRYGLPADYLLCVGTIEPRKNLLTLFRAYCDLPVSLRENCSLVIAGGWGWRSEPVADFYRSDAAGKSVVLLGYTPDEVLPALYAGARALAFPSLYEGFGLPAAEMLACGGAVISSTADALREVLGTNAAYVEPLDVAGWRTALRRAITDDHFIADLRCGARSRAARFSWTACAGATAAVYRSVAPARGAAA